MPRKITSMKRTTMLLWESVIVNWPHGRLDVREVTPYHHVWSKKNYCTSTAEGYMCLLTLRVRQLLICDGQLRNDQTLTVPCRHPTKRCLSWPRSRMMFVHLQRKRETLNKFEKTDKGVHFVKFVPEHTLFVVDATWASTFVKSRLKNILRHQKPMETG